MATATDPSVQQPPPSTDGAAKDQHPTFGGEAAPEVIHEPPDHHHPPNVKAILKKNPQTSGPSDAEKVADVDESFGDVDHHHKKKKSLKWDEHAIEEHDQLRGTRMKIDEPNTPFAHYDHHDEHSDDGSAKHPRTPPEQEHGGQCLTQNWDKLEAKLTSVAAARDAYPSSPSASSREGGSVHSDEEEARRRRHHELEFKMHRKHHYDEMEMLRRFRAEHPNNPLGDEEDGVNDGDGDGDDKMEM